MRSRRVFLGTAAAFAFVFAVQAVAGHGYMREPIQRGMTVGAADYQGPLTNTDCGVSDDEPLNPTMEAMAGDTVLVKWQANHPGSDPEITIKFGDFADRANTQVDSWPVIFNENVYEAGEGEVTIPAVDKEGIYSFQWSWRFGGALYKSCGDILVTLPPPGEEVEESLCPSSCSGHGSCQASSDPSTFVCACEDGWAGDNCESETGGLVFLLAIMGVVFVAAAALAYNRRVNQTRRSGHPGYNEFGSFGGANPMRASLGSKQGGRGKSKSGRGSRGSKKSRGSKNSRSSLRSKEKLAAGGADDRMTQASSVKRSSVDEDDKLASLYSSSKSSKSRKSKGSRKSKSSKGSRRSKNSRNSRGSKRAAGKTKRASER